MVAQENINIDLVHILNNNDDNNNENHNNDDDDDDGDSFADDCDGEHDHNRYSTATNDERQSK